MRYMGIDYGKKRVGISFSDEEGRMAFPGKVLRNSRSLVGDLVDLCKEKGVEGIVIGRSETFNGVENPLMKDIYHLEEKLTGILGVPVYLEPEQFTTVEAHRFQDTREHLDASAAALILQRFLERREEE